MSEWGKGAKAADAALLQACEGSPLVVGNMRIGLLGGSFDPPHQGHVHISLEALKRLHLDQLWWLVSPGNPLKEQGPWPLAKRLRQCLSMIDHPRIKVTAIEQRLGSPYTAQTLQYLTRRFPACRFVWLMGADNMAGIHLWRDWRQIFARVPVAVLERPGHQVNLHSSRAAYVYAGQRIGQRSASMLAVKRPPAWCRISLPLNFESSTNIRKSSHTRRRRR